MSYIITSDALPAGLTLAERTHGAADGLEGRLRRCYRDMFSYIVSRDVVVTGPPFGRYTFHDDGGVEVEAYWGVYLSDSVTQPDPERWRTFVIMPYRALA
jgi:hypothetical protein